MDHKEKFFLSRLTCLCYGAILLCIQLDKLEFANIRELTLFYESIFMWWRRRCSND